MSIQNHYIKDEEEKKFANHCVFLGFQEKTLEEFEKPSWWVRRVNHKIRASLTMTLKEKPSKWVNSFCGSEHSRYELRVSHKMVTASKSPTKKDEILMDQFIHGSEGEKLIQEELDWFNEMIKEKFEEKRNEIFAEAVKVALTPDSYELEALDYLDLGDGDLANKKEKAEKLREELDALDLEIKNRRIELMEWVWNNPDTVSKYPFEITEAVRLAFEKMKEKKDEKI
jgi:hypothetical protein